MSERLLEERPGQMPGSPESAGHASPAVAWALRCVSPGPAGPASHNLPLKLLWGCPAPRAPSRTWSGPQVPTRPPEPRCPLTPWGLRPRTPRLTWWRKDRFQLTALCPAGEGGRSELAGARPWEHPQKVAPHPRRLGSASRSPHRGTALSPGSSVRELSGHFQNFPTVTGVMLSLHTQHVLILGPSANEAREALGVMLMSSDSYGPAPAPCRELQEVVWMSSRGWQGTGESFWVARPENHSRVRELSLEACIASLYLPSRAWRLRVTARRELCGERRGRPRAPSHPNQQCRAGAEPLRGAQPPRLPNAGGWRWAVLAFPERWGCKGRGLWGVRWPRG